MGKFYEIWNGAGWDALDGEPDRTVLEALSSCDEVSAMRDGDRWTVAETSEPLLVPRDGCYVVREVKARRVGDRVHIAGLSFSVAVAQMIEWAGVDVAQDLADLRKGRKTLEVLRAECLEGADDGSLWHAYMDTVAAATRGIS